MKLESVSGTTIIIAHDVQRISVVYYVVYSGFTLKKYIPAGRNTANDYQGNGQTWNFPHYC